MNRRQLCLLTGLAFVLALASATKERYPPGVPPPAQDNDIQFHEPGEFANTRVEQQPPNPNQRTGEHPRGARPSGRHKHTFTDQKLTDPKRDRAHIKAHVSKDEQKYIDLDSLDEPHLIAQYFRNFDLDKDGKVDGLEMLKAIHKMNTEHDHDDEDEGEESDYDGDDDPVVHSDVDWLELSEQIDEEMGVYDDNEDGFITYPEFMRNHRKRIANAN